MPSSGNKDGTNGGRKAKAGAALAAAALVLNVAEKAIKVVRASGVGKGAGQVATRGSAKRSAKRYAEQIAGQYGPIQLRDGRRWIVFKDGEAKASFPPYSGDLSEALKDHELKQLKLKSP